MHNFIERLKDFYKALTKWQRIAIFTTAGIIFLTLSILLLLPKKEYDVLYSNLSPQELARISEKLQQMQKEFFIRDGNIYVPKEDKAVLRLELARVGEAPEGGLVGFEIFDKPQLTWTDFERRVNYRRALEGELARTIASLTPVQSARVFISIPEKRLYTEEDPEPTASIRVHLKPNQKLTPEQVLGIMNMTAYAVENLKSKNVMIVDQYGNILSEGVNPSDNPHKAFAHIAAKQLQIQNYEAKRLEEKIKEKLSKILGRDKVEVFVKWEMSFDLREMKAERYTMPGYEQLKKAEEVQTEELKGTPQAPIGPPGMEAQMPQYKEAKVLGPFEYRKEHRKADYLADKIQEVEVKAPSLTKISVGVFVDGIYLRDKYGRLIRNREGRPIYQARSPEELRKIENIVWATIGADKMKVYKDREYIVRVENIQFDRSYEWALELKEEELLRKNQAFLTLLIGSLVFLIMLIGFGLFLRLRKRPQIPPPPTPVPIGIPPLPEEVPPHERVKLIEEARKIAKQKPQLVAELIRSWLLE